MAFFWLKPRRKNLNVTKKFGKMNNILRSRSKVHRSLFRNVARLDAGNLLAISILLHIIRSKSRLLYSYSTLARLNFENLKSSMSHFSYPIKGITRISHSMMNILISRHERYPKYPRMAECTC